jgi:hypothetical protein
MVTGQINVREYRRPKGQSKKDNSEELTTMVTGQINGGEYRRVVSSSGLSFFDCPFGLRYSLTFICPVTIVVSSSMVTGQTNGGEYRRPKGQSKKDNPE